MDDENSYLNAEDKPVSGIEKMVGGIINNRRKDMAFGGRTPTERGRRNQMRRKSDRSMNFYDSRINLLIRIAGDDVVVVRLSDTAKKVFRIIDYSDLKGDYKDGDIVIDNETNEAFFYEKDSGLLKLHPVTDTFSHSVCLSAPVAHVKSWMKPSHDKAIAFLDKGDELIEETQAFLDKLEKSKHTI